MKNQRKKILRRRRRLTISALGILLMIILILYVILRIEYEDVFYENTIINGVDCSLLTIEQAENLLDNEEEQYELEINFKDEEVEYITGAEIDLKIDDLNNQLNMLKERQRKSLLFTGKKYDLNNFSYDIDKLKKVLSRKKQLKSKYMKEKTKIKYNFNSNSNLFEIKEQNVYYLDFNQVFEEVTKAIDEGKTSISMEKLYLITEKTSNLNELNSFISSKITYQLPDGKKYVLDASTLYTWLEQEGDGNYFKDEDILNQNIEDFVTNKLSILVDTTGKTRKFKPTGKDSEILVEGGNYGYQIDKTTEIEKLKEELEKQEKVTREPCYAKKEVSTEDNSLGKSYVEIDLTRQKVWVYVDGKIEVETNCVTGCVNKGYDTPTGIYTLTYKQKDRILRGRKLPNGQYEYLSHVDYWMPFNGGVGLHDASWRSTFGGNIYINSGSHGCVNLPVEAAGKIYDIINGEMPIVVYKSE